MLLPRHAEDDVPALQQHTTPHCLQAPLAPEIHGETGLDSVSGDRGMPAPKRAAVPQKAVLLMFERISGAFLAGCGPRHVFIVYCAITGGGMALVRPSGRCTRERQP